MRFRMESQPSLFNFLIDTVVFSKFIVSLNADSRMLKAFIRTGTFPDKHEP